MKITTKLTLFAVALISTLGLSLSTWGIALAQESATGTVNQGANLRAGPGTTYEVIGGAPLGQRVEISSTNTTGTWLQLESGQWIAAFLVDADSASPETVAPDSASSEESPIAESPIAESPIAESTVAATVLRGANLRAGPGTSYAVVNGARAGQVLAVQARNAGSTWLQLSSGNWIAAFLVELSGELTALPVATPDVVASVASTSPTVAASPAAASPSTPEPAPEPTPEPEPAGNRYVATQKRLLGPVENGGLLDGPSVRCGLSRALTVNVVDSNGVRLNGVPVQAVYGAKEVIVTGSQGRGDGVAEFILGDGQAVTVLRNADGSPAESETIYNLATDPRQIPLETLEVSGYCQDEETCRAFAESFSCIGHYSWEVTFERR